MDKKEILWPVLFFSMFLSIVNYLGVLFLSLLAFSVGYASYDSNEDTYYVHLIFVLTLMFLGSSQFLY